MKRLIIIAIFSFLQADHLVAQGEYEIITRHEYGLNMSPLLFQLVPFKTNEVRTGPYNLTYNYIRGRKVFSLGLGMRFEANSADEISHFNLRLGYRKYRYLTDHWEYYRGFYFMFSAGSFNIPQTNTNDQVGIGFGFPLGVVYRINDHLSLSTEGNLFLGLVANFDDVEDISPFQIIPPISVVFNVRL